MSRYTNTDKLFESLSRSGGMAYYDNADEDLVLDVVLNAPAVDVEEPLKFIISKCRDYSGCRSAVDLMNLVDAIADYATGALIFLDRGEKNG